MSVGSVKKAVTTALADKKVTLEEAEKISATALRTGGISDAERAEIAKGLAATTFEPGAKAHLEANAAPPPTAHTPALKAVTQIVNALGAEALTGLKDADEEKFSPELKAGIERFAKILGNQDGDTLSYNVRELKAGNEKIYVVFDMDFDKNRELVGFLGASGQELARASLLDKDAAMTMNWENLKTGRKGEAIGTPQLHADDGLPAGFDERLEKFAEKKKDVGDDYGTRVEAEALPAAVRRRYESMQRNIADGTAAEKVTFEGKTVYALRDFSCVASSHFYSESGKRLFSMVEG